MWKLQETWTRKTIWLLTRNIVILHYYDVKINRWMRCLKRKSVNDHKMLNHTEKQRSKEIHTRHAWEILLAKSWPLKSSVCQIQNAVGSRNSRLSEVLKRIAELEDGSLETSQTKVKEEKMKKNELLKLDEILSNNQTCTS